MANYVQPDYRIPTSSATVQPHPLGHPSGNPLKLTWPLPAFIEKLSDKDDPQRTIRGK